MLNWPGEWHEMNDFSGLETVSGYHSSLSRISGMHQEHKLRCAEPREEFCMHFVTGQRASRDLKPSGRASLHGEDFPISGSSKPRLVG